MRHHDTASLCDWGRFHPCSTEVPGSPDGIYRGSAETRGRGPKSQAFWPLYATMSLLFKQFMLSAPRGPLTLANRVVVAPMCQYSSVDGEATDWHLMHWGNLLNSGAGVVILEATAVVPEGRISPADLGLWDDRTEASIRDRLTRARKLAPPTPVFIQLAHAGRKASTAPPWVEGSRQLGVHEGGWETVAPSAISFAPGERAPRALNVSEIADVVEAFVVAARRADRLGLEGIELHGAHGYLIHEFLSPVSNKRDDAYGGSFDGRTRFVRELFAAVRAAFSGVLGIRLSASDWIDGGWTVEETATLAKQLKEMGCDYVHVSSGGASAQQKITVGPGYQVPFAKAVKEHSQLPTMAVGLITDPQQAEDILQAGHADMIALARGLLYRPRWVWEAAVALNGRVAASNQYLRCVPHGAPRIFSVDK
eukprot:m.13394 g.13394  ORF g.13394 m.13394 type:complete len:423 (-) comp2822_c0_seq1:135-1403(-)